jgi:hypothetical protein
MPGVLTVDEVKKLDLGSWPLLIHGSFVHMSVSIGALPPLLISLYHRHGVQSFLCIICVG